jgi:hypothetical protein
MKLLDSRFRGNDTNAGMTVMRGMTVIVNRLVLTAFDIRSILGMFQTIEIENSAE